MTCKVYKSPTLCFIRLFLKNYKRDLAINVPYRLLAPYFSHVSDKKSFWKSNTNVVEELNRISKFEDVFYTIELRAGFNHLVKVNKNWYDYITANEPIIISWIQHKKILFIQGCNPGVPGIIYKLEKNTGKRNLIKVRNVWESFEAHGGKVKDIFDTDIIKVSESDIDHFIPWSYVACDELWNLMPVSSSLNRSKSNKLPDWNKFFDKFALNQFELYEMIFAVNEVRKKFDDCKAKNLNSLWANELLFVEGKERLEFINILKENMYPIYNAARIQGYEIW